MINRFRSQTIRTRLLVGFVLMALLPAIGISAGSLWVGYERGRQQTVSQLQSAAALKDIQIRNLLRSIQAELSVPINEQFADQRVSAILNMATQDKYYTYYNKAMRTRLQIFVSQSKYLKEVSLIDLQNQIILSTNPSVEGTVLSTQVAFQSGSNEAYTLVDSKTGNPPGSIVTLLPIYQADGERIGTIAGWTDLAWLGSVLVEGTGLNETGKAYLIDSTGAVLAASPHGVVRMENSAPQEILTSMLADEKTSQQQDVGYDYHLNPQGIQVVGVYRWQPELQMQLVMEQDLREVFRTAVATLEVNGGIALLAVLLAVGASMAITRGIALPLDNLVKTAKQIAGGDLDRSVPIRRRDEVGELSEAFNSMTAQLRDLINSLEERVASRTGELQEANQALQHKAVQLETSAQVSREATSILNIDDLLARVVDLIREAFGYTNVFIYLVEPDINRLTLRASSGGLIPAMPQLTIDSNSLNGEAVQENTLLLVNDTSQDGRYLADAHMPDTRSELVVPLHVGERVIGTLDVHSDQVEAFSPEDGRVIQSLGDQIAIAIENTQLYEHSRDLAVLEERNRLARELHDSVTQSLFSIDLHARAAATNLKRDPEQAESQVAELRSITHDALVEMRALIFNLRPVSLQEAGLVAVLNQLVDHTHRESGLEVDLRVDHDWPLPKEEEQALFRIAQEALHNIQKHASATWALIELSITSEQVVLHIEDNGRGFDPEGLPSGRRSFGLIGMKERAKLINAAFQVASQPGAGTLIEVRLVR